MRLRIALFAALAGTLLTATAAHAQDREDRALEEAKKRVEGQYIVVFDGEGTARTAAEALTARHDAKIERVWTSALNGALLSGLTDAEAESLRSTPGVAFIEPNSVGRLLPYQYNETWGLDRLDERKWRDGSYYYGETGNGINAYVLDSGIRDTHDEFGTRANRAFDAVGGGQNGDDCNGHGTHVAGTLGGETYGVAKEVELHGVRVAFCNGTLNAADVVEGIDWVIDNAVLPAVMNLSLQAGQSNAVDTAVNNAFAAGIFVVVAAGNDNNGNCATSPQRAADAFVVAATNSSDSRASFSNFGTCVDIFAPGEGVLSAWNGSDTDTNTESGTSMASPHVAGAAALILDDNPGWTPTQVGNELIARSSCGVIANRGAGSPDRMLHTLDIYPLQLKTEGFIFAGRRASLWWQGTCGGNVDIFRNGVMIASNSPNDGYHMDWLGWGSTLASANYWVCAAGSTGWYNSATCSNVSTAYFN